jgi:5-methylcytosine-specific restriction endonuclease McrA
MIAINQNPLSRLTDFQLIQRLDALVQEERETTLEVIRHIIGFDRRKLYLGIGYSSLYDYCFLHLNFSESAAMRRIKTARCVRKFPEILRLLQKNELNITSVCMLAKILTEDNKHEVLKEARYKSKRQVEEIATRYKPGKDIENRVRTIFVKTTPEAAANMSAPSPDKPGELCMPLAGLKQEDTYRDNWVKSTTAGGGKKATVDSILKACFFGSAQAQAMILKKKYKLEFSVEPECMKKLEKTKTILSRKFPNGVPLGNLLEEALDAYLDKHSPERKKKRREKRKAKQEEKKNGKLSQKKRIQKLKDEDTSTNKTEAGRSKSRGPICSKNEEYNNMSRHIPQAVQDEVFTRDEGRCTFVGMNGLRCNSTWNLEFDHIIPYAKGGDNSAGNLRLLCAKHNKHEAEKCYGRHYIERQIQKRNPKRE